jgi:hypothetical protein
MNPIRLSTAEGKAPSSAVPLSAATPAVAVSADAPRSADASRSNVIWTIGSHKVTTHSLAAVLGLLLAIVGPYAKEMWPQAAPAIDAAKEMLPAPIILAPPAAPVGPYERKLRDAWDKEEDGDAKKADKLARLMFLYRRVAFEAEIDWEAPEEISKSFHDGAAQLGLTNQLPFLRGAISKEWTNRMPEKFSNPVTELDRFKVSAFMRETIRILEKL